LLSEEEEDANTTNLRLGNDDLAWLLILKEEIVICEDNGLKAKRTLMLVEF